jgi:hypothetical protein
MFSPRLAAALALLVLLAAHGAAAQTPPGAVPTLGPPSARPLEDTGRISPPPPAERPAWLPIMFVVGPALGAGAIFLALRRNKRGGPPSA